MSAPTRKNPSLSSFARHFFFPDPSFFFTPPERTAPPGPPGAFSFFFFPASRPLRRTWPRATRDPPPPRPASPRATINAARSPDASSDPAAALRLASSRRRRLPSTPAGSPERVGGRGFRARSLGPRHGSPRAAAATAAAASANRCESAASSLHMTHMNTLRMSPSNLACAARTSAVSSSEPRYER